MRKYETPVLLISTNVELSLFDHIIVTLKSNTQSIDYKDPDVTEDNEISIKLSQEDTAALGRSRVWGQWTGVTSDDNRVVSEMFSLSIGPTLYDEVI